jgi:hypothetical protein
MVGHRNDERNIKVTKQYQPVNGGHVNAGLSTEALAAGLDMHGQSIRKRYWQTGSYFGLKPVKLPNGKLRWPDDSVERLLAPSKSSVEGRVQ